MLEDCRERYGDTFTLRLRHLGTWVILSDPEDAKRIFSAGPDDLGVGVPNLALRPVLGAHSVMLSEEPEHMTRRKLMLPRFHGERLREDAEMMTELARREVRAWPVGEPFKLWPRMQALTQEVVMRAVFGDDEGRLNRLRALLTNLTDTVNNGTRLRNLALFGPRWLERSRGWREAMEPVEEAVLDEVRRRRAAVPTWIPFGGGSRRCLAASYAEQEMKRVLRTVLEEVELSPVESRSEKVARGAIAFSPAEHGLVVAKPLMSLRMA